MNYCDCNKEAVYLLKEREFIRLDENIYKIGRSFHVINRLKSYPKSSAVFVILYTKNSKEVEKRIVETFKVRFKQRKDIGNEYFEGDYLLMMRLMQEIYENDEVNKKKIYEEESTIAVDIVDTTNHLSVEDWIHSKYLVYPGNVKEDFCRSVVGPDFEKIYFDWTKVGNWYVKLSTVNEEYIKDATKYKSKYEFKKELTRLGIIEGRRTIDGTTHRYYIGICKPAMKDCANDDECML